MHAYDYALIRVVPRVERGEFVNVGVVLSCKGGRFLEARIELEDTRLLALDPTVDVQTVRDHLAAFAAICMGGYDSGPIGRLPARERFHWLVAPRSTMIQTSPVHSGRCVDHGSMLERLLETMVRVPRDGKGEKSR
ncbi:MAG: DUF3037 domain-containing protein [Dokdonella sp.]